MGFRRERVIEKAVNTERDVQQGLHKFGNMKQWPVMVPNTTVVFSWEADFIGVTRSGMAHEFEVKVSRTDLLSDLRALERVDGAKKSPPTKVFKYDVVLGRRPAAREQRATPNYFWFAVTSDLVVEAEQRLPHRFGIIAVRNGLQPEGRRETEKRKGKKREESAYAKVASCLSARFWKAA